MRRVTARRRTGLERLSIPLGTVDPLWEGGPMGDWVRRNSPDLFNRLESPAPRS
jgi:hypothetical protein